MRHLNKLGFFLILAGLAAGLFCARSGSPWLYAASLITFLLGAGLRELHIIFGAGQGQGEIRAPRALKHSPRTEGIRIKDPVPLWIYVTGTVMAVAGTAVCLTDSGRGLLPAAAFLCILAGLTLIKGGKYFYGEAFARRNYLRDLAAGASFLLILGAVSAGVMLFAGAFDPAKAGTCSAAAIAAFVLGILGMAYGIKYQQSAEGVMIGRAIGFADAETGLLSADGIYDAKGELGGLEVLFNIEPVEAGRYNRERFSLDVLCRCSNPRGVRLEAGRSGFLGTALACFGLGQVKSPAAWDFHDVYSNLPDAVIPPLTKALEAGVIFTEETGLSRLSLNGKHFRLSFSLEGRPETDDIKQILVQAAALAAAFN